MASYIEPYISDFHRKTEKRFKRSQDTMSSARFESCLFQTISEGSNIRERNKSYWLMMYEFLKSHNICGVCSSAVCSATMKPELNNLFIRIRLLRDPSVGTCISKCSIYEDCSMKYTAGSRVLRDGK
jgi:hypothetical protein